MEALEFYTNKNSIFKKIAFKTTERTWPTWPSVVVVWWTGYKAYNYL